jgi:hypothetical protein
LGVLGFLRFAFFFWNLQDQKVQRYFFYVLLSWGVLGSAWGVLYGLHVSLVRCVREIFFFLFFLEFTRPKGTGVREMVGSGAVDWRLTG